MNSSHIQKIYNLDCLVAYARFEEQAYPVDLKYKIVDRTEVIIADSQSCPQRSTFEKMLDNGELSKIKEIDLMTVY